MQTIMKTILLYNEVQKCLEELSYFIAKDISESVENSVNYDRSFLDDLIEYYNCKSDEKYINTLLKRTVGTELLRRGIFLSNLRLTKRNCYFTKK